MGPARADAPGIVDVEPAEKEQEQIHGEEAGEDRGFTCGRGAARRLGEEQGEEGQQGRLDVSIEVGRGVELPCPVRINVAADCSAAKHSQVVDWKVDAIRMNTKKGYPTQERAQAQQGPSPRPQGVHEGHGHGPCSRC